ncbi:D-arginine dehydrogenase [Quadrisphaera granulorum]|uniref:D-arginine dehydrogenase n=1 Tax=Quadrisphaera granulorum TaxID=317664 RepID=A0A316ACZ8_9ACTN|nr:FAD-dependent oxidoreductase [Quadrisphaera granulorum]PWJ55511.1 D-arginine dehydrogenase [Quadrisphaera granulorum]SZE95575.1 D-arginine dehydrogenase [Quadrisphaera granulorum]
MTSTTPAQPAALPRTTTTTTTTTTTAAAPSAGVRADVLVVGGGIAGLSLAAELAEMSGGACSAVLVEAEPALATHTSARSARQMQPSYGPPPVQALTAASLPLVASIEDFTGRTVLRDRPLLWVDTVGGAAGREALARLLAQVPALRPSAPAEALERFPLLRPEAVHAVAVDDDAREVAVPLLLEHHAERARRGGVQVLLGAPVTSAVRRAGGWDVTAGAHRISAGVLVDAAGPWADVVAALAGVRRRGLVPKRRTVIVADTERPIGEDWPMISDVADTLYARPGRDVGGDLLASPAEAVPSEPCDAQPVPADVDALVTSLGGVLDLGAIQVKRSWTGLRTGPADGLPVVGWDDRQQGFFWLAGQGGYGIQTSSALARAAAAAVLGQVHGLGPTVDDALAALAPSRPTLLS